MSEQIVIPPAPSVAPASKDRTRVAAWWHTVLFIAIILGMGAAQAVQQHKAQQPQIPSRMALYAATIIFELVLLGYVWLLGLRPAKKRMRDLIGGKWSTANEFWRDVAIAGIFWLVVLAVLSGLTHLLGSNASGPKTVEAMLPRGTAEMAVWIALCVTAGFVEEVLFRGYLQRQFFALTGSYTGAIVLQAVVFGSAHLYQGVKNAIAITVYGALFGILAVKAKSLRPGMLQHAAQDSAAGIVGSLARHYKMM